TVDFRQAHLPAHRDVRRPRWPFRPVRRVEGRIDRARVHMRRARRDRVRLHTADGLSLEAEWASPSDARAIAVLCHPHPQYGGTMRSIVISALFEALPERGIACLRFNFRGVEGSEGSYAEGRDEPLDVAAALDAATVAAVDGPLALIGWSFGADIALGIDDRRVAGWVGIAPPLRFRPERAYDAVGH